MHDRAQGVSRTCKGEKREKKVRQLDDLDDIPALWLSRRLLLFSFINRARLLPLEKQRMTIQSNKQTTKEKEAGVGQLCFGLFFSLCLGFFSLDNDNAGNQTREKPSGLLLRYCCGRVIPPLSVGLLCNLASSYTNRSIPLSLALLVALPADSHFRPLSLSVLASTPFFLFYIWSTGTENS